MNLFYALKSLFPEAEENRDYVLKMVDNIPTISEWYLPYDKPSEETLIIESLKVTKAMKKKELSDECNQRIYNGFRANSNGHIYQFELLDQINLSQQYMLILNDPLIEGVYWKSVDAGIYYHTTEEFKAINLDSEGHKRGHIQHYWSLCVLMASLTTEEDVMNLNWNSLTCPVESFSELQDA